MREREEPQCKFCGARIEWTMINGQWVPWDAEEDVNHQEVCPFTGGGIEMEE